MQVSADITALSRRQAKAGQVREGPNIGPNIGYPNMQLIYLYFLSLALVTRSQYVAMRRPVC